MALTEYRLAHAEETTDIAALLSDNQLPTTDLPDAKPIFWVAVESGLLVGCVGVEKHNNLGILRSLAVVDAHKGLGIGKMLVQTAINASVELDITTLYLLTQTAAPFFAKQNWTTTDRSLVPSPIAGSSEFAHICPSTAQCMRLSLKPLIAQRLFASGFNCAQSVFAPFAVEQGINIDQALMLATGFGAGIAHKGDTCGTITGAIMAMGLMTGRSKSDDVAARDKTYANVHRLVAEITNSNGSIICRELLKTDLTTIELRNKAKELKLFETICAPLVVQVTKLVQSITDEAIAAGHPDTRAQD